MAKKNPARKSDAILPGNKKSTISTEIRIVEIADLIVKKGYSRIDCMKFAQDEWGLSEKQSERYYYGALNYLKPDEPDKYREALINRNFSILEGILKRALDSNDLKTANDVVKTMNQMLGVGGKQVEIKDKDSQGEDRKIVISFND